PLVTINHIEAHLYACQMIVERPVYPCVGLVVSGGHTHLYDCRSPTDLELIGWTIDDAAGEAFDKAARVLDLDYPGGPVIDRRSANGNPKAHKFPRPMIHDKRLRFSFSGLKTAILYEAKGNPGPRSAPAPPLTEQRIDDLCASFQAAVVDVLIAKCKLALKQTGYRTLCVGGGVACNSGLRKALDKLAQSHKVLCAPPEYCTDNAAMGAIGWELFEQGIVSPLDVDVTPGLIRVKER
ncbi:MAG: tRNA (adenosine(37)-N6)-threonylcarbamoyltransferase complex transferase subunit TsaD, partial [Planctomycetaceae bacterium]